MAIDNTLKTALRRFGLNVETHVGAPWTYRLPGDEVVHLCWQVGEAISWLTPEPGVLVYRDTFEDFEPARPGPNAPLSFELLGAAKEHSTPIRCILVTGTKTTRRSYTARPEFIGTVMMAIPAAGRGIEIAFRKCQRTL